MRGRCTRGPGRRGSICMLRVSAGRGLLLVYALMHAGLRGNRITCIEVEF